MNKHVQMGLGQRMLFAGLIGILVAAQGATAATTGVKAYNVIQTTQGDTTVGASDGKVTIAFGGQSADNPPSYYTCNLLVDGSTANAAFVGNYTSVAGISFRIKSDTGLTPGGLVLILTGATGRNWYYRDAVVSPNRGVWVVNNVALTRAAGWDRNDNGDVDKDAMWAQDMANVQSLTVSIVPSGTAAQSYTIDALMLKDASTFAAGTSTLTLFEAALLDQFGVTSVDALTDAQKAQSTLVSGLTDLSVIRGLNDANFYASSLFAVNTSVSGAGITVGWYGLEGKTYRIMRSANLTQGFTLLTSVKASGFTGLKYMTYVDESATGSGPYFYKILMSN